jgi:hypothetical protein
MLFTLTIGIVAGVMSGVLGIGGATILVPAMVYFLKINQTTAQGTSLWIIIPTALSGAIVYARHQQVNFPLVILMALGAIIGAWLGASLAQTLPQGLLRKLFGFFFVVVGLQMILRK